MDQDGCTGTPSACNLGTPCDLSIKDRRRIQVGYCVVTTAYHRDVGLIGEDGKPLLQPKHRSRKKMRNKRQRLVRPTSEEIGSEEADGASMRLLTVEDEETKLRMQLMGLPTEFFSTDDANAAKSGRRQLISPQKHGESYGGYHEEEEDEEEQEEEDEDEGCTSEANVAGTASGGSCGGSSSNQEMEEAGEGGCGGVDPDAHEGTSKAQGHEQQQQSSLEHHQATPMMWQQAFDPQYNAYYYYRQATQETQWEPPEEGFVPAPYEWSHHTLRSSSSPQVDSRHPQENKTAREAVEQRPDEHHEGLAVCITSSPAEALPLAEMSLLDRRPDDGQTMTMVCEEKAEEEEEEEDALAVGDAEEASGVCSSSPADDDDDGACPSKRAAAACARKAARGLGSVTALGFVSRKETTGLLPKGAADTSLSAPSLPGTHVRFPGNSSDDDDDAPVETIETEKPDEDPSDCGGGDGGASEGGAASAMQLAVDGVAEEDRAARSSALLMKKYWYQRFSLFSRFKEGIRMDEEAWYSVTPEAIANHQASRCGGGVAVDAFTGAGGNAIALAQTCNHVIAIDCSAERVSLARSNAAVYGLCDKVDFLCADFFRLAPHLRSDVVFLSPPWGGPEYSRSSRFDLKSDMGGMGLGLEELLGIANGIVDRPAPSAAPPSSATSEEPSPAVRRAGVAAFLPRNIDLAQVSEIAETMETVFEEDSNGHRPVVMEVERNILNGKLKGVTLYCGDLPVPDPPCPSSTHQDAGMEDSEHGSLSGGIGYGGGSSNGRWRDDEQ